MKDKCLISLHKLIDKIVKENSLQIEKWGIQDHSAFEWYTILAEEFGELGKALLEYRYVTIHDSEIILIEMIIKEAISTATCALKIAEMFDMKPSPAERKE